MKYKKNINRFFSCNQSFLVMGADFYLRSAKEAEESLLSHQVVLLSCCVAYSISSIVETRDSALNLFLGKWVLEVVSRCFPHQWGSYCGTRRNQTDTLCYESVQL